MMDDNSYVTLTEEELINKAIIVRKMTAEEEEKFEARLKYNEQFYENCTEPGADVFSIPRTNPLEGYVYCQPPVFGHWWYNMLQLVEFTMKDLHMEDIMVKIEGIYSDNASYNSHVDDITIVLHNGRIYKVDSTHFSYPRETYWMQNQKKVWTFGYGENPTTEQIGDHCFTSNGLIITTYKDGTFLSRKSEW